MIAAEFPKEDDLDGQFSYGWKAGLLVAAMLALITAPLGELPKYYVAVPALIGVALAILVIARGSQQTAEVIPQPAEALTPTQPPTSTEVVEFRSDLWLQLKKHKASQSNQLDLFEQVVEDASERRKIHRLRTDAGDIYLVLAERWQELLVSRVLDTTDKATDHALAVALKRSGWHVDEGAERLLSKLFREQLKCDFRGSIVTMLSREGAKLTEDLASQAMPAPEKAPATEGKNIAFTLEAQDVASGKKKAK